MPASTFNEYRKFLKSRGVNYVNLFLCNYGDGEYSKPGYSIYGPKWTGKLHKPTLKLFEDRIKILMGDGHGIFLWSVADESKPYTDGIAANPRKFYNDLKASGLLEYASALCLGLEMYESFNSKQVAAQAKAAAAVFPRPIGTHQKSGNYNFSKLAGVSMCFFQVKPGASAASLVATAWKIKKASGRYLIMFEIEREPAPEKCTAILKAGDAFSVGNV